MEANKIVVPWFFNTGKLKGTTGDLQDLSFSDRRDWLVSSMQHNGG